MSNSSRIPFDEVTDLPRTTVYDVDYLRRDEPDGGQIWFTRYGWAWQEHLSPELWYRNKRYVKHGTRLTRGTGAVYRIATPDEQGRELDLVIKFSRFAQDVPLHITVTYPGDVPHNLVDNSRFNSPFYEFGQIKKIRQPSADGTPRILSGRPLAIYSPPARYKLWQLGRTRLRFDHYARLLAADQQSVPPEEQLQLDMYRQYIVIYSWEKGDDAELAFIAGKLTDAELFSLTQEVQELLEAKGFLVLDNKPRHYIVRTRKNGELMRRNGKLVYSLIDFELLVPMPWLKSPQKISDLTG